MKTLRSRYSAPLRATVVPSLSSRWRPTVSRRQSPKVKSGPASLICRLGGSIRVRRRMALIRAQEAPGPRGFRQIVVGTHFEPDDPIHLVVACGEHQHRRGFGFPARSSRHRTSPSSPGIITSSTIRSTRCHRENFSSVVRRPQRWCASRSSSGSWRPVPDFPVVVNDKNVIDMFHWVLFVVRDGSSGPLRVIRCHRQ